MAGDDLAETPSQTIGPFYHFSLLFEGGEQLVNENTLGERITVEGRIFDGKGEPVTDCLIEIWQADSAGRYNHPEDEQDKPRDPNFNGFGRVTIDDDGWYRFYTVKPGPVQGLRNAPQAPHINISILGRGILKRIATRFYFEDEPANDYDPVLNLVPEERRASLIARRVDDRAAYRMDIFLQGENETVFFEF